MDDSQNYKEGALLPAKRLGGSTASLPKLPNVTELYY